MQNTYLNLLATQILCCLSAPISKVKFAKIIYFSFKNLVMLGLEDKEKLKFIRMPLGPVPDGFMSLDDSINIEVTDENLGLTYNQKNYCLSKNSDFTLNKSNEVLNKCVQLLNQFSTSSLVEISHNEPSWKNHLNGDVYFISKEDLKLTLPVKNKARVSEEMDKQLLQAQLLFGMQDEVVKDSTALEYPSNY